MKAQQQSKPVEALERYILAVLGLLLVRHILPAPNARDGSDDNQVRYDAYRSRANFVNFVSHTKEGMLGMVFRKPYRN